MGEVCNWQASETLSGLFNRESRIYIFITQMRETDQSNWFIGVEYISMFHPNVPPLILRVVNGYVATDTVVPRREYPM